MAETYTKGVTKEDGTPVFAFDTDNSEFVRGFEAGALFLQLSLNPGAFELAIQNTNSTMLRRMADATERAYVVEAGEALDSLVVRVMPKGAKAPEVDPEADVHL